MIISLTRLTNLSAGSEPAAVVPVDVVARAVVAQVRRHINHPIYTSYPPDFILPSPAPANNNKQQQVLDPPAPPSSPTPTPTSPGAPIIRHAMWGGGEGGHPEGLTWQGVSQVRWTLTIVMTIYIQICKHIYI